MLLFLFVFFFFFPESLRSELNALHNNLADLSSKFDIGNQAVSALTMESESLQSEKGRVNNEHL